MAEGLALSLGLDQHTVIDLLREARAFEMHHRLDSMQRGRLHPVALFAAATNHVIFGWPDAGQRPGRPGVGPAGQHRTAGSEPEQIVLTATDCDVDSVIVDVCGLVRGGNHVLGTAGHCFIRRSDHPGRTP